MAGVELRLPDGRPATNAAMQAIKTMLQRGYILLPEGEHGNVISFTPPLTITRRNWPRPSPNSKRLWPRMKMDEHGSVSKTPRQLFSPMDLVAADVSPLHLIQSNVRADSRRLLQ